MRGQVHSLELVFPPISNQEAEWVKNDKEVKEAISRSNLYFIGQKPETYFTFEENVQTRLLKEYKLHFNYVTGSKKDSGYIDINELFKFYNHPPDLTLDIELGPKLIRIWSITSNGDEIVEWFTTDKILFDRSRDKPFIKDFNEYRVFFTFNLHYVGISKKETGFERLIVRPHDKRLRILSNEHPLNRGSRVTDEIVLFFFRIKSLEIKQYITDADFDEFGQNELEDYNKIVADAEKAFVKIMETQYNEVKFSEYPYSTDGLFNTKVERHTFSIDENITFITDTNSIVGRRKTFASYSDGDFIAVSKESVELIKVE